MLTNENESASLLGLIGTAIEQLQRSIELFETSSQGDGVHCLSEVIHEIDTYMEHAGDDPLLRLASIDVPGLSTDLDHIKNDLLAVITEVNGRSSTQDE